MKINITKRFLLSLCLMTLTLLCGGNKAWGQAKLPVSFNGGKGSLPTGFTQNGLGDDYSSAPKLKFDDTGDYLIVQFDSDPSNFSCSVKQNGDGSTSNKFEIQYSTDGSTYTTFATVSNIGSGKTQTVSYDFSSLKGVRYIKWIYTKKRKGNYGLGKISIEKATTSTPTPTLKPSSTSLTFPQIEVNTSSSQTFTLSGENLTGDATLSLSDTKANLFSVTPTTVTPTGGVIKDEKITVTYTPTEAGTHTATLTISSEGAEPQTITLNGTAYQIYNVNWKVNGADYTVGAPTTEVESGSAVTTLPTAPSKIAGKTFMGWTDAEIATPSASAPATLFKTAANAPAVTSDVTYYAVFASASGTGEGSEELTKEEIINLGLLDYDTEKTYSGAKLNYSIFGYKDVNGADRPWIQLKKDKGSYIKITAPDNITKMNLKISSATNLKGGIEDISKHTIFSKTDKVGLVTEDCSFTTSSKNIGSILGDEIVDNLVTIATTSESKVVYLKVSTGARIWGITTYFSDLTYSNYVTTVPLTFSDEDDLTASLPTFPLTDQTFTLNRNVYKGWNTFCVPFKLTQAQLEKAYGNGAVAKYLSDVTTDAEGATLHFAPETNGGIEANKAYLLYLTADVKEAKTFSGVTLERAGKCTTTVRADNGDDYTFQGILAPTALETNDRQYFLNSAGTYFVLPLNNTSQMKATRAYIIVPAPAGSAQGRQYSFDFNGTTTAIDNVTISGMEDGAWYTISGIRVNRPAAKGVYIHNGRKVIVK